ncbi:glycoside hydrolase family 3 protein [Caulobacter sp. Root655]|uniref:beta-glucosidase n=1 Tax=Caulobacter sp. Root655 TaxID=1736578 RepID=UPI0009E92334|nr:glycoside hydrolase family 3 C-terminal domain-containing protein [Caulobacter sp. Root655]
MPKLSVAALLATTALGLGAPAHAATPATPAKDPDARAAATEARMTDDERFSLLSGIMPVAFPGMATVTIPPGVKPSAGYVSGVPRLGVPALRETDASLGVSNVMQMRPGDVATALPSGLSLAASFNPDLAYRGGAMVGGEARAKGFNVLLAGGMNLTRDPRNGRNFEYLGEDPLLAGVLAGESIRGVQSQGVISTIKHFALNAQETLRMTVDARIDPAAHRESDLLAFEIGIERGQPGSVMCAYNQVNGAYACGNDPLLNGVLKGDWAYKGWVMSDWGAVHDVGYFAAGLDQQSGSQLDKSRFFDGPLKAEVAAGRVSRARVSDAVRRVLRSIYAVGADWEPVDMAIDYAANGQVAREAATQGVVLLKNDGALPLAASAKSILVVGGYADAGVMSGGGSSQVSPVGGQATYIPSGGPGFMEVLGRQVIVPSSPLRALRKALPDAKVSFDSGYAPEAAVLAAAKADVVIVFATQWQSEGVDSGSLTLANGQDALIAAVAKANPNVVVVLETGNPVAMPWLGDVKAVVEAWYPGQEGGAAIADVLTGAVSPSGRLPMTFPKSLAQTPHPVLAGYGAPEGTALAVDYKEGAEVGYRWLAAKGETPLFAFGHGLSYTRFEHGAPALTVSGKSVTARFSVANVGARAGADVPQLYLVSAAGKPLKRLAGFSRVDLKPGETREVSVTVDPRLLASWRDGKWRIAGGAYRFALGRSAEDLGAPVEVALKAAAW